MSSLYLRKDSPFYWIDYSIDGIRQKPFSTKTKDKSLAKAIKAKLDADISQTGAVFMPRRKNARQIFEEYKRFKSGKLTRKTSVTDFHRIQTYIEKECIISIQQITENSLKAHLDQRITDDKISHQTANHTIAAVKAFMYFALKSGYVMKNPIARMEKFRLPVKEPKFLTTEELCRLIEAAKNNSIFPVVATAVYTGLRYSEVMRLEETDVDLENGILRVNLSKSGRFRLVPVRDELKNILKDNPPPFKVKWFADKWNKTKKAAKLNIRFHDLRHTFCSLAVMSGVDLRTVRDLAGHQSIKTTMNYAHLLDSHLQSAMKKINFSTKSSTLAS